MKKTVKAVLISPIVILWDVSYWVVSKVYEGMTFIDQKGEKIIDQILED
jgi:hypothetical protein